MCVLVRVQPDCSVCPLDVWEGAELQDRGEGGPSAVTVFNSTSLALWGINENKVHHSSHRLKCFSLINFTVESARVVIC